MLNGNENISSTYTSSSSSKYSSIIYPRKVKASIDDIIEIDLFFFFYANITHSYSTYLYSSCDNMCEALTLKQNRHRAHKANLLNIDGPSQANVSRGRANADAVDSMYDLPRPSSDVPDRDV